MSTSQEAISKFIEQSIRGELIRARDTESSKTTVILDAFLSNPRLGIVCDDIARSIHEMQSMTFVGCTAERETRVTFEMANGQSLRISQNATPHYDSSDQLRPLLSGNDESSGLRWEVMEKTTPSAPFEAEFLNARLRRNGHLWNNVSPTNARRLTNGKLVVLDGNIESYSSQLSRRGDIYTYLLKSGNTFTSVAEMREGERSRWIRFEASCSDWVDAPQLASFFSESDFTNSDILVPVPAALLQACPRPDSFAGTTSVVSTISTDRTMELH